MQVIGVLLTIAIICIPSTVQLRTKNTSFGTLYIAGVVEYMPSVYVHDHANTTYMNLLEYIKIIESNDAEYTDIIVFPEDTLNDIFTLSYVPDAEDKIIPCNMEIYNDLLSPLSCVAKKTKKYIVVNMSEKMNCTAEDQKKRNDPRPCSIDGLTKYNTNVVFDRKGMVVSRYRKWHLFGEHSKNTTLEPEYAIFETDFGVKFGHFICFDVLFYTPAIELVRMGIKDFLFPSMWFSELPFLTAVQIQQAWAYANDVNLLSAGASNPKFGSTGTGIYAGKKGALVSVMSSSPQRKLYVATINKSEIDSTIITDSNNDQGNNCNEQNDCSAINVSKILLKHQDLKLFNTVIMRTVNQYSIRQELCYSDLCCDFRVAIHPKFGRNATVSPYVYRFAAYAGNRNYYGAADGYIQVCGIIACKTDELRTCGILYDPSTEIIENNIVFHSIEISTNMPVSKETVIMPNSIDASLMPLAPTEFKYEEGKRFFKNRRTFKQVQMQLLNPRSDIVTFSIYGNGKGGSSTRSVINLASLLFFYFFVQFLLF